ncbi:hypothetical protein PTTG_25316 [Puccinia triticina 1-1 BBBD Race 1]|uniref:Uncharacterized protein n=1 Tax=Puccinia triticina (isolate 1-1 / race 1 (BBBD)) TaxID=630390 RepID=A0A180H4A7_PUCT1|nr:hypothetical protein PTTG_25316 [Puccinia triticina 1-1 BBBD Race 1]
MNVLPGWVLFSRASRADECWEVDGGCFRLESARWRIAASRWSLADYIAHDRPLAEPPPRPITLRKAIQRAPAEGSGHEAAGHPPWLILATLLSQHAPTPMPATVEHNPGWLEGATVASRPQPPADPLPTIHLQPQPTSRLAIHPRLPAPPTGLRSPSHACKLVLLSSARRLSIEIHKLRARILGPPMLLHHHSLPALPASTRAPTLIMSNPSAPSSPGKAPQTSPRLTRPTLNVTPAEPVLSRPSLPRSASAVEPFSSSSLLLLPSAATSTRPTSFLSSSYASLPTPPALLRHQRSRSALPSLALITPFSIALACPHSADAQALLQRALEDDDDARAWAQPEHSASTASPPSPPSSAPIPPPPTTIIRACCSARWTLSWLTWKLRADSTSRPNARSATNKESTTPNASPKCQLEFCSRDCRVSMGDGQRHQCA